MKQLAISLLMLLAFSCSQKNEPNKIHVTGVLNNVKDTIGFIKYSYTTGGKYFTDSVKVENGKYSITVDLALPELFSLSACNMKGEFIPDASGLEIFLEPGEISVTSNNQFKNLTISGSKSNDEYNKFKKLEEVYTRQEDSATKHYSDYYLSLTPEQKIKEQNTNSGYESEESKRLQQFRDTIEYQLYHQVWFSYLTDHPNSPIAMHLVTYYAQNRNLMNSAPFFYKLPQAIQNSNDGKYLKTLYERNEATDIGKTAPDFTSTDTSGKKVSLSDYKGKYVLLDFWANWCHWCRVESPFMNKALKKYQSKNFTIISVSFDKKADENLWKQAIIDDHYVWTNLSDLQGVESPLFDTYGIVGLPKNLLIDPSGKIIAKDLRGENLEKSLHEILDK